MRIWIILSHSGSGEELQIDAVLTSEGAAQEWLNSRCSWVEDEDGFLAWRKDNRIYYAESHALLHAAEELGKE